MIAIDRSKGEALAESIREMLAKTAMSERAIARALGANKCTVSRIRRRERISRPADYKPKKQTVNHFREIDADEIARRAEEVRSSWPRWRIEEQERLQRVDYSRETFDIREVGR